MSGDANMKTQTVIIEVNDSDLATIGWMLGTVEQVTEADIALVVRTELKQAFQVAADRKQFEEGTPLRL